MSISIFSAATPATVSAMLRRSFCRTQSNGCGKGMRPRRASDLETLSTILTTGCLNHLVPLRPREETPMADPTPPTPPTQKELRAAFKAFKKRLKVTQLDEDSKLSKRPTTSGGSSRIVAIEPPNQFGKAVWEELVKEGKLKKAGHGMYELVEWWTLRSEERRV